MPAVETIWHDLDSSLKLKRREAETANTNRVVEYLISYYSSEFAAHRAVLIFSGGTDNNPMRRFGGWDEVRVATLREIEEVLKEVRCSQTWELAITIKDFLQNMWDTLDTVELDGVGRADARKYIDQLRGGPWVKNVPSPFRPESTFNRRSSRSSGDPVVPLPVVDYIEYLFGHNLLPPLDFYTDRTLTRLGMATSSSRKAKLKAYRTLLGDGEIDRKHWALISFGKLVCQDKPRCNICPISRHCAKN